ncbi:helix-turn-helix domain-containing protein [Arthrobacter sp. RCC_34]|uniref:helix-turn-helix domain-containing protein n=1 Tax=Arthrobacter sp. RCC_34 TaxID=3239230 RepID=UPI003523BF02
MKDIEVIEDPQVAEVSLDPMRSRILEALVEPASAATVAGRIGAPRQKVNYHLKALESAGLVQLVEERRKGNMTERVMQSSAGSYLISPLALASMAPKPEKYTDRFSAFWMLALAGRLVQEVGKLIAGAVAARKPLATFAIDAELSFASARDRAEFAQELSAVVDSLVEKYHDADTPGARRHRLVLALHPELKAGGQPAAPAHDITDTPDKEQDHE